MWGHAALSCCGGFLRNLAEALEGGEEPGGLAGGASGCGAVATGVRNLSML